MPNLPNPEDEMDLNVHGMSRSLIHRAKIAALGMGVSLKYWLTTLIEHVLAHPSAHPLDPRATISARRDLPPAKVPASPTADPPNQGGRP